MKEIISVILVVAIFSGCLFISVERIENNISAVVNDDKSNYISHTVILDAGHGGEDSGAVASDGTFEKDINLAVAKKLSIFFDIFGINYVVIRNDDSSIGDTSLDTIRKRKVSDINKRYEIINSYDNSILLSIHQNMFPVEKYSGMQVFYADIEPSDKLAQFIQTSVCTALQPENTRKIKACNESVFLLYKAKVPSVMVECGFLSNNIELENLKNSEYQSEMSYFICRGLINYLINIKDV